MESWTYSKSDSKIRSVSRKSSLGLPGIRRASSVDAAASANNAVRLAQKPSLFNRGGNGVYESLSSIHAAKDVTQDEVATTAKFLIRQTDKIIRTFQRLETEKRMATQERFNDQGGTNYNPVAYGSFRFQGDDKVWELEKLKAPKPHPGVSGLQYNYAEFIYKASAVNSDGDREVLMFNGDPSAHNHLSVIEYLVYKGQNKNGECKGLSLDLKARTLFLLGNDDPRSDIDLSKNIPKDLKFRDSFVGNGIDLVNGFRDTELTFGNPAPVLKV